MAKLTLFDKILLDRDLAALAGIQVIGRPNHNVGSSTLYITLSLFCVYTNINSNQFGGEMVVAAKQI